MIQDRIAEAQYSRSMESSFVMHIFDIFHLSISIWIFFIPSQAHALLWKIMSTLILLVLS